MEKQILHQRFVYAEIRPYVNYSKITDKPKNIGLNTFVVDDDDKDDDNHLILRKYEEKSQLKTITDLYPKEYYKKKNTKFFYNDELIGQRIKIKPYFKNVLLTNKEKHIRNHSYRPFSSIVINIYDRTIFLKDDKITIKINHYIKTRYFNSKFFVKKYSCTGFSIDLKKGYITTFIRNSAGFNKIRRNSFVDLKLLTPSLFYFENDINSIIKNSIFLNDEKFVEKFKEEFNDQIFLTFLYNTFKSIEDEISEPSNENNFVNNRKWTIENIIKIFIKINKIKVPDNYGNLIINWYPKKYFLKKNDNKLVASILDRLKIKSKKTIKLIHENPHMSVGILFSFVKYFGFNDFHKYIGNLNPKLYTYEVLKSDSDGLSMFNDFVYDLNDRDKSNILKLFNDFFDTNQVSSVNKRQLLESFQRELNDHIRMLTRIREVDHNVSINAQTITDFKIEHLNFTIRENTIKRGFHTEYIFDDELISTVEEVIETENGFYYPIILKKDLEYTFEGKHMHHCVGGYYDQETSVIVSIRHLSNNGSERITCEYETFNKKCVQAKYFCNANPPEHFNIPLSIVSKRILEFKKSIKSIKKLKIEIEKNTQNLVNQNMGQIELF